jgi:aminoglycoside N3'-acetyltransferase
MEGAEVRSYTADDLRRAFLDAGVRNGDLIYLSTRLYGVGVMQGVRSRQELLQTYFGVITDVLGRDGTLVVPTFTEQVGRYGVPFVWEETVSLTGIFGEFVRRRPDSVRSMHPVFSVTAVGARKAEVCADVSPVALGYDSAFDRMVKLGGKSVCVGFDYYSGHIVTFMHHVETLFGVPYYYNKLVRAPVCRHGRRESRPFVINVMYRNLGCDYDFRRYIDFVASRERIRSAAVGETHVYSVDLRDVVADGVELLKRDPYAFLTRPPQWIDGTIPAEGPETPAETPRSSNWEGFYVGRD